MRLLAARPRSALLLAGLYLTTNTLAQRTTAAAQPAEPEEEDDNNDAAKPSNDNPPALETPKPDAPGPTTAPAANPPATNKPADPAPTVEVPKTTNTAANEPAETKPADKPADENTPAANPPPSTTTAGREETFTVSGGPDAATGTNTVSAPIPDATITGGPGNASGGLGGLPKLPSTGVPIPTAQVPPTANAPYMQHSKLPAGTVFIAVGAVLGAFFLAVLLWRGLTVWALKRNMRRAAERVKTGGNAGGDTKQLLNFRRPDVPMGGYREGNRDSMLSLGRMPGGTRTPGRGGRPQTASSTQGHASTLFFSPTAQGAGGMQSNRGSTYLPSGYYAAGSAAPGNGAGMTHLGGNSNISLTNLGGPPTQGYARARSLVGETPPDSPSHRATGDRLAPGGTGGNFSTSTLDLNQRPTGRAPSAYLEDLFDEAGATPGNYPLNDSGHPNYNGSRI